MPLEIHACPKLLQIAGVQSTCLQINSFTYLLNTSDGARGVALAQATGLEVEQYVVASNLKTLPPTAFLQMAFLKDCALPAVVRRLSPPSSPSSQRMISHVATKPPFKSQILAALDAQFASCSLHTGQAQPHYVETKGKDIKAMPSVISHVQWHTESESYVVLRSAYTRSSNGH